MFDGVLSLCRNYQAVVALVVPKTCTSKRGITAKSDITTEAEGKGDSPSVHAAQLPASKKSKNRCPKGDDIYPAILL